MSDIYKNDLADFVRKDYHHTMCKKFYKDWKQKHSIESDEQCFHLTNVYKAPDGSLIEAHCKYCAMIKWLEEQEK